MRTQIPFLLVTVGLSAVGCGREAPAVAADWAVPPEDSSAVGPDPRVAGYEKAVLGALTPRPYLVEVSLVAHPAAVSGQPPAETALVTVWYADGDNLGVPGLRFQASICVGPGASPCGVWALRADRTKVLEVVFDPDGRVSERVWHAEGKDNEAALDGRCRQVCEAMRRAFGR